MAAALQAGAIACLLGGHKEGGPSGGRRMPTSGRNGGEGALPAGGPSRALPHARRPTCPREPVGASPSFLPVSSVVRVTLNVGCGHGVPHGPATPPLRGSPGLHASQAVTARVWVALPSPAG